MVSSIAVQRRTMAYTEPQCTILAHLPCIMHSTFCIVHSTFCYHFVKPSFHCSRRTLIENLSRPNHDFAIIILLLLLRHRLTFRHFRHFRHFRQFAGSPVDFENLYPRACACAHIHYRKRAGEPARGLCNKQCIIINITV